jgi:hypothetical protein
VSELGNRRVGVGVAASRNGLGIIPTLLGVR